ncbi:ribonuclease E [Pseudoalteromonas sp. OOF1S-7]|uniref:ribonuclease E n=1 Tax=Pseudoalteromonas sp. OOF1S-7 TaxID=2917757 RepID=UPI001EF6BB31|nr:ribonuclease E [Pseudoalteromonas sp. OOF1S-7]MCG7533643.1 ribonuclease E [Pseudoalteromonas sp. OOF1S-7]
MKRMLINATQQEEMRVALVDGQRLYDLDIESPGHEQKKANIYKGKITRIEPSLEAAFVDYGAERHGFLPLKEIAKTYFPSGYTFNGRPNIKDVIKEGQEVIVQVDKEERGQKGAALTTFISVAGSYLVLMPNNPRAGGISRRIEGDERIELKEALSRLNLPKGMGLIVRTAGVGKSFEELEYDLKALLVHWEAIQNAANSGKAPFLIHQESNVIFRAIRDYLRRDIGEILIDKARVFEEAKAHIERFRPDFINRVKLYQNDVPLFTHYQIESQIESAFQREVRLPSGGSIVIDPTEALTSIDINSSKATKGGDIEETALNTNLEAADEIARQLRLRDLGGLIVIDFIDMTPPRHQREVENRLKDAVRADRARVQIGKISRFGLLEMSRQRLRPSLGEASQHSCPRCDGQGTIRSNESIALSILRLIEEEAIKENTAQVNAQVPVKVGSYLLNEKRRAVQRIEKRHNCDVVIIPNQHMETPHYDVVRLRKDDVPESVSYEQVVTPEVEVVATPIATPVVKEEPVLKGVAMPTAPAPAPQPTEAAKQPQAQKQAEEEVGLLSRIGTWLKGLFGGEEEQKEEEQPKQQPRQRQDNRRRNQQRRKSRNRNDRRNDERNDNRKVEHGKSDDKTRKDEQNDNQERSEGRNKRRRQNQRRRNDSDKSKQTAEQNAEQNAEQKQDGTEQVTQEKANKPRRQRRNLKKKVRIESETQVAQATDEAAKVQPEGTQEPVQQPEQVADQNTEAVVNEAAPQEEVKQTQTAETSANEVATQTQGQSQDKSQVEETPDEDQEQREQPRTRSRRSPRHLRAAGQKRKRNENKDATPAFVPVADQAAAEFEAELNATAKASDVDSQEAASVSETEAAAVKAKAPVAEQADEAPKADIPAPVREEEASVVEASVTKSVEEAPISDTPATEPVEAAPIADTTVTEPVEAAPIADTPATEPVEAAPIADTPATEPVEAASIADTPATEPVEAAPIADTPANEPVEAAPIADTPATEPVEAAPIADTPATEPVEEAPIADTPATEPVEEAPIANTPAAKPVEEVPVAAPPAEHVEEAPAETAPLAQATESAVSVRVRYQCGAAAPMTKAAADSSADNAITVLPMPDSMREKVSDSGQGSGSKSPTARASSAMASPASYE